MSRAPLLSLTALRVLAVTALSFSMLAGCGKAEEKAEEAATEAAIEAMSDAEVDVEDGGQTITGVDEEGNAFAVTQGDAARLPADFPKDLLVPEGLALETSIVVGGNMMVGGTVTGERDALAAQYAAHMKDGGWASVLATTDTTMSMQTWQLGQRTVSVMIESREGGTVNLTISHAEEPAVEGETAPSA